MGTKEFFVKEEGRGLGGPERPVNKQFLIIIFLRSVAKNYL